MTDSTFHSLEAALADDHFPDVDLTLTGLGAGGVVLPNARPLVGTVANITALTRPAGTMGFATDASGGAKPCWSTGSGWVLADGTTLT